MTGTDIEVFFQFAIRPQSFRKHRHSLVAPGRAVSCRLIDYQLEKHERFWTLP